MLLVCLTLAFAADPSQDVAKVLDDWHLAAAKANEEAYFGHLSEQSIFLGTDATERWNKKEFREFATADKDAETIVRRSLDIAADICVYTNRNVTIETL